MEGRYPIHWVMFLTGQCFGISSKRNFNIDEETARNDIVDIQLHMSRLLWRWMGGVQDRMVGLAMMCDCIVRNGNGAEWKSRCSVGNFVEESSEKKFVMITQTAEYALRAVVYLADQDEACTTSMISEKTQIPGGYLAKVMQGLSKAGLVHAQRGLHGGFVLAIKPEELTVLRVVNAVEPIRRFHECPLGLHGIHLCPLHRKLDDAAQAVENCFGDTTVADLVHVSKQRKPLCTFPLG